LDLPESEHDQKKRERQQQTFFQQFKRDLFRRLHKASFLLEVVGVLVVISYTYLMNGSLTQQVMATRPVVLPHFVSPNGNGADVTVMNFGKTVALEVVVPGEVVSIDDKEIPPYDPRCRKDRPPRNLYATALAPDAPYTAAEAWTLRPEKSGKIIYAVGCIYYKDLAKVPHYTDICTELIGNQFIDCKLSGRNSAE
jgi:hypothetical protein